MVKIISTVRPTGCIFVLKQLFCEGNLLGKYKTQCQYNITQMKNIAV